MRYLKVNTWGSIQGNSIPQWVYKGLKIYFDEGYKSDFGHRAISCKTWSIFPKNKSKGDISLK